MWVLAEYQPTTLFSLRPATATTSGGKSLITPTSFAVKMALLDVAIRTQGLEAGRALFPTLRSLRVALRLPEQIVVNSTFTRILRLKEIKSAASEKPAAIAEAKANSQWPFQRTIAYREYVQFGGALVLAFQGMALEVLSALLFQLNYLGKRGGFMQLRRLPEAADELPTGFTEVTSSVSGAFPLGVLQLVDDFGPTMTFEHADIYNEKGIRLGKERVLHHVVLPYQVARSSRSFTLYERFEE
jgi:hypothetical protein